MISDLEKDRERVAAELAAGATTVVSAHGSHAKCVGCGVEGHGEQAHAPLAPSAASHWVNCAGWLKMSQMFPERSDNQSGLEGTAAHWVLSEALYGRIHPLQTLAPNGIAVTQEMHEGAELFINNIPDDVMAPGGSLHVESRVGVGIDAIHLDCWGTPDAWWVRDNVLHVADYKFGHGFVDEWMNWQLICYAAEIIAIHPQFAGIGIELHICQPRCFNQEGAWRTWRLNEIEMREYVEILRVAALAAYEPGARCVSGSHCAHCSAITHCPAAQVAITHAINTSSVAETSNMPIEAMGLMRNMIADAQGMLKAMADGLDIELEAHIRAGGSVPGWAMMPGKGKTDWTVSTGEIAALGEMFGVTLRKDAVITPIQARTIFIKAGIDPSLLDGYSASTAGALKLVASDANKFKRIFS